ncbi:MAG: tRNA epoxyqueuosine(34) reductase QueG [Bacteroidales bacterium]|nr:tRNA epoxyqueuosine(34) reductase QueG [Bacteroidales bacterium]MDD6960959.1 tRNA epoxyqueuosine(34) reductase QueG [Bacteroidales bacterium]MDY6186940.1 tRNA epoxyqueuosine(34) reductase QueG [Muribaculaceae bacterium]
MEQNTDTAKAMLADIRREVFAVGAYACGVVRAMPVTAEAVARYEEWLADGNAGNMDYLGRYGEVRRDPRLLLDGEGARTLIVTLFAYQDNVHPAEGVPYIAHYALGQDYHDVLRRRLKTVIGQLRPRFGGKWRICVDSAPLMERYWAARAGLGVIGDNGCLIVPGVGANFFIATIVTTAQMPTDDPVEGTSHCLGCGRCVRACPTGALRGDGSVDARRCISYLTIESHDDIPADIPTGNTLYGCDVCRRACPLACCKTDIGQGRQLEHSENLENSEHSSVPTSGKFAETMTVLPEFTPDSRLLSMTVADWRALDDEGYAALTAHSAMRRVSLDKLRSTLRRFPKG